MVWALNIHGIYQKQLGEFISSLIQMHFTIAMNKKNVALEGQACLQNKTENGHFLVDFEFEKLRRKFEKLLLRIANFIFEHGWNMHSMLMIKKIATIHVHIINIGSRLSSRRPFGTNLQLTYVKYNPLTGAFFLKLDKLEVIEILWKKKIQVCQLSMT